MRMQKRKINMRAMWTWHGITIRIVRSDFSVCWKDRHTDFWKGRLKNRVQWQVQFGNWDGDKLKNALVIEAGGRKGAFKKAREISCKIKNGLYCGPTMNYDRYVWCSLIDGKVSIMDAIF